MTNMVNFVRRIVRRLSPPPLLYFERALRNRTDLMTSLGFIFDWNSNISFYQRLNILRQFHVISYRVDCGCTQHEILSFSRSVLSLNPEIKGVIVEAGAYKGGGTSKFSLVADIVNRKLVVFDSFQGIPHNSELHETNIFGGPLSFSEGQYRGDLDEVKTNVAKYGKITSCTFVEGWFEDTLPEFHEPIAAIFLDVDLASSTRSCLRYLYPLLETGGVLYSQDGHIPLVIEVLRSDEFWRDEVGCPKPQFIGIGEKKLIMAVKKSA